MALHDLHCHLGLMPSADALALAHAASDSGALLFNNTVTPEAYRLDAHAYADMAHITTGIGIHPWYVENVADDDLEFALSAVAANRFVGEIGLDAGSRHKDSLDKQARIFEAIAATCGHTGGCVLSIHAVSAADLALDILERAKALDSCTCIFHWFSGTSNELARARKAGMRFSIGPRMLASKRGRAYGASIEARLLLLETDAPDNEGDAYSFEQQQTELKSALTTLEQLRDERLEELIQKNAADLLLNR